MPTPVTRSPSGPPARSGSASRCSTGHTHPTGRTDWSVSGNPAMQSRERTTMDEHPNAKVLRDMADRMKAGDFGAALDGLADDVEWHEIGRAEPTRGKEALAQRYKE